MVLNIIAAVIEACPGSSRGAKEKGVKMVSKGIKEAETVESLKMNR